MLTVSGLTVRYGDHLAVEDLTLHAGDGEVLCVLGPSGCGKSTLLRAIAGLVVPDAGSIELDGDLLDGLRPDQRRVGLMFQDHALFPHRTVADNVGFGPRMQGLARTRIAARVQEALALVDLEGTADRAVTSLSGGEQQRVALARAIAAQPRLLMLDEPLGSLDRTLRDRLLVDLPPLLRELGTTVLYVTHDQDEALALADRVAVMRAGHIQQIDAPDQLWRSPRTAFVARFLGLEHVLEGTVDAGVASTVLGAIAVPDHPDGPVELALLLDALRLADALQPVHLDEIEVPGTVIGRRFAGDHLRIRVRTRPGLELTVPVWRGSAPAIGSGVRLALDPTAVQVLEPDPHDAPSEPGVAPESGHGDAAGPPKGPPTGSDQ